MLLMSTCRDKYSGDLNVSFLNLDFEDVVNTSYQYRPLAYTYVSDDSPSL